MEVVEGTTEVDDVDGLVADLGAIGEAHGVAIQAFDARYVTGRRHLDRAVAMADRARAHDDAIARERAVEILLYAAGRRQITRALEMGVDETEGEQAVVVVVAAPAEGGDEAGAAREVASLLTPAETLGAYDEALVGEFFDVAQAELAATDADLPALVRERVALLAVEK